MATFKVTEATKATNVQSTPTAELKRTDQPTRQLNSGMVGIASGQTVRINVVNTAGLGSPPGSARMALGANPGTEIVAESTFTLEPGVSAFLDVPFDKCLPPGPSKRQNRHQIRAMITVLDDPNSACIATVELYDDQTGRTTVVMQIPEWPPGPYAPGLRRASVGAVPYYEAGPVVPTPHEDPL